MGVVANPSLVIVRAEDSRHGQFIRRYLRKLGLRNHAMRILTAPAGEGSAEQWVRNNFVMDVQSYRIRKAETKLVVMIDADTHTVEQRLRQLDESLHQAGISLRDDDVKNIARLVPRRNIETWILCISGRVVGEDENYRYERHDWTELIRNGVDTLDAWTRRNATVPESCVHSLRLALPQLRKLDPKKTQADRG